MGSLANKVWVQPESLAGSAPRPCGHEDLTGFCDHRWLGYQMRLNRAVCASNRSQGAAVARACTVKRGATIADLASEFLARMSGSAGAGTSVDVVPTPTDPAGIRRCARDL